MKILALAALAAFALSAPAGAAEWCFRSEPVANTETRKPTVDPALGVASTDENTREVERRARESRKACDCESCVKVSVR